MIGPLVSTDWLAEHLDDPDLRVVDIRGHTLPAGSPAPNYFSHREEYERAHVPGAVFVDWIRDITEGRAEPRVKVAPPDRYAAFMGRIGVGEGTTVVAYDDAQGMFAARLWWTLRYHGHDAASVLDGGWDAWIAEGRPVTAEVPTIMPAEFVPRVRPELRRTMEEVLASLGRARLVDTRPAAEFAGKASRARRMGHIPGAASVPRNELVDDGGRMLPPDVLRERFADAGVGRDEAPVILYCSGGVAASYGLLAMEVAGLRGGTVYDGSWREWGNTNATPVEGPR
jgi:thiosulfate/3-mercaptopyruvate sulfurtransferase